MKKNEKEEEKVSMEGKNFKDITKQRSDSDSLPTRLWFVVTMFIMFQ